MSTHFQCRIAGSVYFSGVWLSLVERYVRDVEVASSNLVTPTTYPIIFLSNNIR